MENRKQEHKESFADFSQDIEALSVRLTRRMPEEELVELMRRNMQMHLREALWRQPTDSVDELITQSEEYERLCAEEERQNRSLQRRTMRVNEIEEVQQAEQFDQFGQPHLDVQYPEQYVEALHAATGNNDNVICWNCKDLGHTFTQCHLPQQSIFRYSCGMEGVLRAQCSNVRCAGNLRRNARPAGATRSSQLGPQLLRRTTNPPAQSSNPFGPQDPVQK